MKPAINIHNYEEFFLLYADNELSAAERLQVERFVENEPRLRDELRFFCELKLTQEEIVFAGKESLLRQEAGPSTENYEAWFLSYADGELSAAERTQVETFVLQHPVFQKEFLLLKELRLPIETINCPDKASLYKKDKPVIIAGWRRLAAAAAITGIALLTWLLLPGIKPEHTTGLAVMPPKMEGPSGPQKLAITAAADNKAGTPAGRLQAAKQLGNAALGTRSPDLMNGNRQKNLPPAGDMAATKAVKTDQVAVPRESLSQLQTPAVIAAGTGAGPAPAPLTLAKAEENNTAAIASPAVYKELDTEEEDKSLYLGSLEINKDKLRGFFRKAGSLLRGKAKQQKEDGNDISPSSSNTRSLR